MTYVSIKTIYFLRGIYATLPSITLEISSISINLFPLTKKEASIYASNTAFKIGINFLGDAR
jgi:hypothetical protein